MTRPWVLRFGRHLIDPWTATERAEVLYRDLVARGMSAERAAEVAARNAVSEQLVGATLRGERQARDQLVEIWLDPVHRWCRVGAGRGVSPEDAAHDALIAMIEGLARLRDPAKLYGWVWGLVWRVLRAHERRARPRFWSPWRPTGSVESEIDAAEREHAVRQILAALPLDDRALLTCAYVEGRSRDQIAAELEMPLGTVNRRLTRARVAFRAKAEALGLDGFEDLDVWWEQA